MHTVRGTRNKPTLFDFSDWLKKKAEGRERMKM